MLIINMTESSRRSQKVASQIKENLSWIVEHKFRDPGKGFITITKVRLSPDLKIANIYYSVLGKSEDRIATDNALKRAKSYLRHELGNRLKLRYLPELRFFYDDSLDYSDKINRLLNEIHKNEPD
jgi:ribosome-binding factor A